MHPRLIACARTHSRTALGHVHARACTCVRHSGMRMRARTHSLALEHRQRPKGVHGRHMARWQKARCGRQGQLMVGIVISCFRVARMLCVNLIKKSGSCWRTKAACGYSNKLSRFGAEVPFLRPGVRVGWWCCTGLFVAFCAAGSGASAQLKPRAEPPPSDPTRTAHMSHTTFPTRTQSC